jgi:protein disulfide-isomerase A1
MYIIYLYKKYLGCGHCKTLAPEWDAAAETLKNNKNVVITKIDSTANEVDGVEIKGFPTLKFYPGNDKANPVDYEGERTAAGIISWLKEHAT